eukprot:TRINITY_DN6878_c0_g1_i2.p3 TRINITY_DN6878_c0_g1~~TRINITY_DN6878_c0_g1_i2.p3  ORF type:complete len:130 (+),score=23.38 TRINITY_DN6878_c0_g1_i2:133-522(+)
MEAQLRCGAQVVAVNFLEGSRVAPLPHALELAREALGIAPQHPIALLHDGAVLDTTDALETALTEALDTPEFDVEVSHSRPTSDAPAGMRQLLVCMGPVICAPTNCRQWDAFRSASLCVSNCVTLQNSL